MVGMLDRPTSLTLPTDATVNPSHPRVIPSFSREGTLPQLSELDPEKMHFGAFPSRSTIVVTIGDPAVTPWAMEGPDRSSILLINNPEATLVPTAHQQTSSPAPNAPSDPDLEGENSKRQNVVLGAQMNLQVQTIQTVVRRHDDSGVRFQELPIVEVLDIPPAYTPI